MNLDKKNGRLFVNIPVESAEAFCADINMAIDFAAAILGVPSSKLLEMCHEHR